MAPKDVDDDYGDKRIVPGFMDIHCHGAYEFDTNDANEDGLRYWQSTSSRRASPASSPPPSPRAWRC